jgi:hypothetical protein
MNIPNTHDAHVGRLAARRRWLNRSLIVAGSAIVALVALLNAGVNPSHWYQWFHRTTPSTHAIATRINPVTPVAALPRSSLSAPATRLPGTDSSVSNTPQRLILTGTVLGRNFKEGYAMLGVARENPQTYTAGALVANGAHLLEIHSNYVVLQRGERVARLYLDGSGLQPNQSSTAQ